MTLSMTLNRNAASATEDRLAQMRGYAFVNGEFCPLHDAKISVLDYGFIHSDATYDAFHVWKGMAFRLHDHVERFVGNVAKLRLQLEYSGKEIAEILLECVSRSTLRDAQCHFVCTRGVPRPGSRDPRTCINTFLAYVVPFAWINPPDIGKSDGIDVIISRTQRIPPTSLDPRIKNFHWLDLVVAQFEAFDRGADNVILPNSEGNVTEGPGFNVFVAKNGSIATPESGVFEGMTRRSVIELCGELKIAVEIRPIKIEELKSADEVFLTSTAGGVTRVRSVDGSPVGLNRRTGDNQLLSAIISDRYWQRKTAGWYATPVNYSDADRTL